MSLFMCSQCSELIQQIRPMIMCYIFFVGMHSGCSELIQKDIFNGW